MVVENIDKETKRIYLDSKRKALASMNKETKKKNMRLDAEFDAMLADKQDRAASHVVVSMQHYASLNDKAYKLRLRVNNILKRVNETINTPIEDRVSFQIGLDAGKARYSLDVSQRGINNHKQPNSDIISKKDKLIEADKPTNLDEIEPSSFKYAENK